MFVAEAQTGRQIYGGRQPGTPRRTQPMYDDQPMFLDQPVVVEQPSPRLAPMPPGEASTFPVPFRSGQPQTILMEGPVVVQPAPIADPDPNRPLSGIDFPSLPTPRQSGSATTFSVPEPVKTIDLPTPRVTAVQNERIDEFYARLAKLQLEKKQLAETLALIGKIKSDTFKVKTLVELAEYVAHDTNYKKEADQLFSLAQSGIGALTDGKPISVVATESAAPSQKPSLLLGDEPTTAKPSSQVEEKVPPRKSTLLDEPVVEEKKPAEVPKKQLLLDDEPAAEEKKPTEAPKKQLLLDDEPAAEEKKPTEAPKKRPPLILGDDPTEKSAPKESEPSAKSTTRRSMPPKKITLDDE